VKQTRKVENSRRARHHRQRVINNRLNIIKNIWKVDLRDPGLFPAGSPDIISAVTAGCAVGKPKKRLRI